MGCFRRCCRSRSRRWCRCCRRRRKDEFEIVLVAAGDNKINVIKEIRTITQLGLKEAKDLVDGAPKTIKESAPKAEAEEIKKKLEAAGAKVELK